MKLKNTFNKISAMLATLIISIITGYLLLVAVYCIPYDLIKDNVNSAFAIQMAEKENETHDITNHNEWYTSYYKQDWNAVSVMLSELTNYNFIDNTKNTENNVFTDSLLNKCIMDKEDKSGIYCSEMEKNNIDNFKYSRYWHGYLTILKPLFVIFNFQTIRIINIIFQLFLTILVCLLMYKKNLQSYIISFLLACLLLGIPLTGLSFQLSSSINIMLLTTTILLWKYELFKSKKLLPLLFFITGIIINYVDFFTFPLITFGIPFIFVLLLEGSNYTNNIKKFLINFCAWIVGYALFWGSKWILCSLLTNEDVIFDAFQRIKLRTGLYIDSGIYHNVFYVFALNLASFIFKLPFFVACIFFIAIWILCFWKKSFKVNKNFYLQEAIPYLIICALPFIWYLLLQQHSGEHSWFAYRNLSIFIFSLACLATKINYPIYIKSSYMKK